MIENEQERQEAYIKLRHWQGIAANRKESDASRQDAPAETRRCVRAIAEYERT